MIKKSFALRVLALCFLLLALPLLINTLVFFKNTNSDSIKQVKGALKEEAIIRTFSLQELISIDGYLINGFINILENQSKQNDFSVEKLNQLLIGFHELIPNYNFLLIEDPLINTVNDKIISASDPSQLNHDFPVSYCTKKLLEGEPLGFIRRFFNKKTNSWQPHILAGRTLKLNNINFPNDHYIFIIYNDISNIVNEIMEPAKGIVEKYFAIVQHEGFILAASDPDLLGNVLPNLADDREEWKRTRPDRLGDISLAKKALKTSQIEDPPYFEFFFKDRLQIAYSKRIPVCAAYLIAYSEKHAFYEKEIKDFLYIYFFYGVILILGGGITFWLTIFLSRPLQQLATVMNNVEKNNLKVRYNKAPMGYEINFLGEVFNATLDSLLENMQKLEDEKVEKETFRKEVAIGKEVQKRLIPHPTLITDEVEIEGRYKGELIVGGDFHDYSVIKKEDNSSLISLVVADASGKGISSCLYALSLRSLLRSNVSLSEDIGKILQNTNNSFLELAGDTGMFVTLLMGMYHTKTGIFNYYSFGNPPGFILRGEELIELEHRGMAMGLIEIFNVEVNSIQLQKGDFVIFFTDGLLSTLNQEGIIFSKKRVEDALKSQKWSSAKELVTGIINVVNEFTVIEETDTELTLLVMKIK